MKTAYMTRDEISARLASYGIRCAAAVGLLVVIVLNAAGQ
jgi:hypothetical protein